MVMMLLTRFGNTARNKIYTNQKSSLVLVILKKNSFKKLGEARWTR
jgi:hypothetical protein